MCYPGGFAIRFRSLVFNAEFTHQTPARFLVYYQRLDTLAEMRIVAERALQRFERIAQRDHLAQLRHFLYDCVRREIVDGLKFQIHCELRVRTRIRL